MSALEAPDTSVANLNARIEEVRGELEASAIHRESLSHRQRLAHRSGTILTSMAGIIEENENLLGQEGTLK
jgi:hypothetical protein